MTPNPSAKIPPTSKTLTRLYLGQDFTPHGNLPWWKCSNLNPNVEFLEMGHLLTSPEGAVHCLKHQSGKVIFDVLHRNLKPSWKSIIQKYIIFSKEFFFSLPMRKNNTSTFAEMFSPGYFSLNVWVFFSECLALLHKKSPVISETAVS